MFCCVTRKDFDIVPDRCGYKILLKGKFWSTADNYSEAEEDIREECEKYIS